MLTGDCHLRISLRGIRLRLPAGRSPLLQVQVAFGNGFRCVGGQLFRLPTIVASGGQLDWALDIANPPSAAGQITAGSTWNFQAWFRDPAAGGSLFDTSDGYEVVFQP